MEFFKRCCALLTLAAIASAIFPSSIFHLQSAMTVTPAWVPRALYLLDAIFFGVMYLGLRLRRPIYWKAIPILLAAVLLNILGSTVYSLIELSLPWMPFMFIVGFAVVGYAVFLAWWKGRRNYFVAH